MSEDEFYRIKRLPPYVIAEVNAMRAAARAAGEDIIDLGMGNPDLAAAAARHRQAVRGRDRNRTLTAIRSRRGFRGCAARRPIIMRAASTSNSTPKARSW